MTSDTDSPVTGTALLGLGVQEDWTREGGKAWICKAAVLPPGKQGHLLSLEPGFLQTFLHPPPVSLSFAFNKL